MYHLSSFLGKNSAPEFFFHPKTEKKFRFAFYWLFYATDFWGEIFSCVYFFFGRKWVINLLHDT